MKSTLHILFLVACQLALPLVVQGQGKSQISTKRITFVSWNDWKFDAKIVAPESDQRNGYGVLLIGGGVGNDLDWTTPGRYKVEDRDVQVTISGKSHADAPRLASSLAKNGFVVMHWTTVSQNDPKRDAWPMEITYHPPKTLLRFAKDALRAFREQELFAPDRVVLMGHSLGGARAANLAKQDGKAAGLVLLASAHLCRTGPQDKGRNIYRAEVEMIFKNHDVDQNGRIKLEEFTGLLGKSPEIGTKLYSQKFQANDCSQDGLLAGWEIAGSFANKSRQLKKVSDWSRLDGQGLEWTEDILHELKIPILVVYGTLDESQSYNAPILKNLKSQSELDHVDHWILNGLGHQLGEEKDGKLGPIDSKMTKAISGWLTEKLLPGPAEKNLDSNKKARQN